MLALGVAVGAAIGPAPETSLAGERIPLLLPAIAALTGGGAHTTSTSTAAVHPPPVTPQPTPAASSASAGTGRYGRLERRHEDLEDGAERRRDAGSRAERRQETEHEHRQERRAGHAPARHERVADHALRQQLRAGARADDRRPLPRLPARPRRHAARRLVLARRQRLRERGRAARGEPPQTLDSIVQPPCPEGAAGTACAPETAGALTAADEFLKATLSAITASAAYREHGLVVITFGAVGNATASSLPAGASTATLSSEPPVGVLLLSPFARAGARPTSTFNPTSPKQSLARLLH